MATVDQAEIASAAAGIQLPPAVEAFTDWIARDARAATDLDAAAMERVQAVLDEHGLAACAEQILTEHALKVMPQDILDTWTEVERV